MPLKVNEIYFSIQGESTHSGKPCIFIRLTFCNLRCSYCDTEYAFYEGKGMEIADIIKEIKQWDCKLVEVTGGEPLVQDGCIQLLKELLNNEYKVLLETGGSLPIDEIPKEVIKIVDFKCPSSNMEKKNLWLIVDNLESHDEVKFVIGNRKDFTWAKEKIIKYNLTDRCTVLFSPTYDKIEPRMIVQWILDEKLPVRFQLQLHKQIWPSDQQGV